MALEETGLPQAGEERVGTDRQRRRRVGAARAALGGSGRHAGCGRLRERFDHFAQTVDSGSRLFAGARTLASAGAHGYPMALVTNKPTPFVAPLLAALSTALILVIGGDDVTEKKPHPAPLHLVLGS